LREMCDKESFKKKDIIIYVVDSIMHHLVHYGDMRTLEEYDRQMGRHMKRFIRSALQRESTRYVLAEKFAIHFVEKWQAKNWFAAHIDGMLGLLFHAHGKLQKALERKHEEEAEQAHDHMAENVVGDHPVEPMSLTPAMGTPGNITPFGVGTRTPLTREIQGLGATAKAGCPPTPCQPRFLMGDGAPGTPGAAPGTPFVAPAAPGSRGLRSPGIFSGLTTPKAQASADVLSRVPSTPVPFMGTVPHTPHQHPGTPALGNLPGTPAPGGAPGTPFSVLGMRTSMPSTSGQEFRKTVPSTPAVTGTGTPAKAAPPTPIGGRVPSTPAVGSRVPSTPADAGVMKVVPSTPADANVKRVPSTPKDAGSSNGSFVPTTPAPSNAKRVPSTPNDATRVPSTPADAKPMPSAAGADARRVPSTPNDARRVPSTPADAKPMPSGASDVRRVPSTPNDAGKFVPSTPADAKRVPSTPGDAKPQRVPSTPSDAKPFNPRLAGGPSQPQQAVKRVPSTPKDAFLRVPETPKGAQPFTPGVGDVAAQPFTPMVGGSQPFTPRGPAHPIGAPMAAPAGAQPFTPGTQPQRFIPKQPQPPAVQPFSPRPPAAPFTPKDGGVAPFTPKEGGAIPFTPKGAIPFTPRGPSGRQESTAPPPFMSGSQTPGNPNFCVPGGEAAPVTPAPSAASTPGFRPSASGEVAPVTPMCGAATQGVRMPPSRQGPGYSGGLVTPGFTGPVEGGEAMPTTPAPGPRGAQACGEVPGTPFQPSAAGQAVPMTPAGPRAAPATPAVSIAAKVESLPASLRRCRRACRRRGDRNE